MGHRWLLWRGSYIRLNLQTPDRTTICHSAKPWDSLQQRKWTLIGILGCSVGYITIASFMRQVGITTNKASCKRHDVADALWADTHSSSSQQIPSEVKISRSLNHRYDILLICWYWTGTFILDPQSSALPRLKQYATKHGLGNRKLHHVLMVLQFHDRPNYTAAVKISKWINQTFNAWYKSSQLN